MRMQQPTRVVLALDAPEIGDEIVHALDRSGGAEVVATAADERQLAEAVRQLEPDLVVAEPRLAAQAAGKPCITVASRESIAALRAAIEARSIGFFVWPAERDELIDRVRRPSRVVVPLERRASVVAVHASRGGAGCTFVTTQLAAAMAARGRSCVVVDADPDGDDFATVLGIDGDDDAVHSLADLASVAAELGPTALVDTVWKHEMGFAVIVAPRDDADAVESDGVRAVVDVAAAAFDVVLVHTSRGLGPSTRAFLHDADAVLEVLTLDVASFRGATRTISRIGVAVDDPRWRLVVNKAARSEVVPGDVQRVFGRPAAAVIPADGAVLRAHDRRRPVSQRSRAARAIARLAAEIAGVDADEGAA
jgi:MinD-like ATPase involved in chromosome partitioning or flagellar assembly